MNLLELSVNTPSGYYPIFITQSLQELLFRFLGEYSSKQAVIITNETIAPLYLEKVQQAFVQLNIPTINIILPDGEQYKNSQILNTIYDRLLENRIERSATIFALGGGVIGDITGFTAATYQRGVPFVQIPTTLLSQVDSSVGGKTAINHPLGKNMIGAFYQPKAVFIAQEVLKTLPKREFSAGMAEVIKYALLGDINFLQWLENNIDELMQLNPDVVVHTIKTCCQMKAEIVSQDEKEAGCRALLNLGHTFAHAIEAELGYGVWLHGEAVSAGMVLACQLSQELGYLKKEDVLRVRALLRRAGLPDAPPKIRFERWLYHMQHDKKVLDGTIRFVLLRHLGEAFVHGVNDNSLLEKVCLFDFN